MLQLPPHTPDTGLFLVSGNQPCTVRKLPPMLLLNIKEVTDDDTVIREVHSFTPTCSGLTQALEKMQEIADSWAGDFEKETFWLASLVCDLADPSGPDTEELEPITGQIAWIDTSKKHPVRLEKRTHETFLRKVRR